MARVMNDNRISTRTVAMSAGSSYYYFSKVCFAGLSFASKNQNVRAESPNCGF